MSGGIEAGRISLEFPWIPRISSVDSFFFFLSLDQKLHQKVMQVLSPICSPICSLPVTPLPPPLYKHHHFYETINHSRP